MGANTGIDWDRAPQSAVDVFKYLPRALQIALFAPFPDTWLQKPGLTRLAGVGETALWYCIAPGLLLAMAYRRTLALTVTVMFAVLFMAVFGFVTPNVGTLYRYRYAYEFILMVVAIGGWATFILKRYGSGDKARLRPEPTPDISLPLGEDEVSAPGAMKGKLLGAAAAVSTLTLIGSLGLFARDLLMVHWLGAGSEMDSFILGIMIPMFFVSVLSIPAGAALVPVFSALRNTGEPKALASAVSMIALMISALLAVVVILLYFSAPYLLTLLGVQYSHESLTAIREIMNIYLLILLLSGLVVNANAVLNTVGATVFPALAQLIVPVMVLLALLMFGAAYGVYAAAYGMLAGQIANLLLLVYGLWKWKILPALKYHPTFTPDKFPFHQYSILASTALLTALLSPLANALAANLQTGSVAVIGLGTKVVLLLTGAIGMGMTAVLLPYFSGLAAKFHHQQARSDLSFFLLLVTLLSVPLALLLTVLADPVTRMVFANSALTEDNIQSLVRVIQYGVVQLPFFTCGLVATRYITAYQRTGVILLSSLAGLVVALALGIFFMRHIGVGGIALGMTLAMAVSAMILVAHANYLKHLPVTDSIFIVFNWVVFLTLFICLHYGLYVGAAISGGAYVLLVAGNWRAIVADSYSSRPRFLRRPG